MKRTPLSRRTPLQRQQLQRQRDDHLSRRPGVMPKRNDTGPSPATRKAVEARDGSCVVCGMRALNVWPPPQIHHRRPRQMGGTVREDTNGLANLILLCSQDHQRLESHRTAAYRAGLLLRSNEDPAAIPVLWHSRLVFLGHDGSVIPAP